MSLAKLLSLAQAKLIEPEVVEDEGISHLVVIPADKMGDVSVSLMSMGEFTCSHCGNELEVGKPVVYSASTADGYLHPHCVALDDRLKAEVANLT